MTWRPGKWYAAFVAGLVLAVFLSPFLVVAVVSLATVQSKRVLVEPIPGGVTTTGKVVSVHRDCGKYGCSYQPTVAYTDLGGSSHTFDAPETGIQVEQGSAIQVSYDRRDPDDAHDISLSPSDFGYETGSILLGIYATVVLGVTGAVLLLWNRIRAR